MSGQFISGRILLTVFAAAAIFFTLVTRLPAPISEESPTPALKRAIKPKVGTASSESSTKPKTASPQPKAQTTPNPKRPYTGTWTGVVTWGIWGDYEHTIIIDDQQTIMSVKSISTVHGGTGTARASIDSNGITGQLSGLNGKWTLQPFPDGKTANVRVTGVLLDTSAIFRRVHQIRCRPCKQIISRVSIWASFFVALSFYQSL